VPDVDKKRAVFQALVDRVLNGEGRASSDLRARAFSNADIPPALQALIGKVATSPAQAKKFTHEAMRGPSAWSVADRELMAAFVSKVNESAFCVGAHTATAGQAYADGAKVQAVLTDLESAPVEDALAVCAAFNTTDRLADAFGFGLLTPEGFEAGATYLLKRGYR
jgi:AhpD family alkylhydroperoxidase